MTDATQQPQSDTVPVDDLDSFVRYLAGWHMRQVNTLKHFLTVPDGTEMELQIDGQENQSVVLTGDMLVGFKAGIEMALTQLGELPFVIETTEPEGAANDEPAPGN